MAAFFFHTAKQESIRGLVWRNREAISSNESSAISTYLLVLVTWCVELTVKNIHIYDTPRDTRDRSTTRSLQG